MAELREPGFTVRLRSEGTVDRDDSFWYWGDRLPYVGQFIEVSSEYGLNAIEAQVTRLTPDEDIAIHAAERTD